jgi:hypothetical protein
MFGGLGFGNEGGSGGEPLLMFGAFFRADHGFGAFVAFVVAGVVLFADGFHIILEQFNDLCVYFQSIDVFVLGYDLV